MTNGLVFEYHLNTEHILFSYLLIWNSNSWSNTKDIAHTLFCFFGGHNKVVYRRLSVKTLFYLLFDILIAGPLRTIYIFNLNTGRWSGLWLIYAFSVQNFEQCP